MPKKATTKKTRHGGSTRPRRKKTPGAKGARMLSLQMAADGVVEVALEKTETVRFTFPDHDPVQYSCGQLAGVE